ncbi:uncharacterized protein METZ01_LOCUS482567, partial [marine metagenome]
QEDITSVEQYMEEFCPPEGMIMTLHHIEEKYGGIREYMRAIGMTEEQVRYLHDAVVDTTG